MKITDVYILTLWGRAIPETIPKFKAVSQLVFIEVRQVER
jgi:hypothetical protein